MPFIVVHCICQGELTLLSMLMTTHGATSLGGCIHALHM